MIFPADYEERWLDQAGEEVLFRHVRPEDKPLFVEGLRLLSPVSIYNRFMAVKAAFTAMELVYLTEVDQVNHLALVALKDGELVGVSRVARYGDRPEAMDFGLIVADCQQGKGIGHALLLRSAYAAREREADYFCGEMFASNTAMFHLIDTFLAPADWVLTGAVASFEIELKRLPEPERVLPHLSRIV